MELQLVSSDGLPKRSIISMNTGPSRQTLVDKSNCVTWQSAGQAFKLSVAPWPLQIDVYTRLAKSIESSIISNLDEHNCCKIMLESDMGTHMRVTFRISSGNCNNHTTGNACDESIAYFQRHRLKEFFQKTLAYLASERPSDPYQVLAKHMHDAAKKESLTRGQATTLDKQIQTDHVGSKHALCAEEERGEMAAPLKASIPRDREKAKADRDRAYHRRHLRAEEEEEEMTASQKASVPGDTDKSKADRDRAYHRRHLRAEEEEEMTASLKASVPGDKNKSKADHDRETHRRPLRTEQASVPILSRAPRELWTHRGDSFTPTSEHSGNETGNKFEIREYRDREFASLGPSNPVQISDVTISQAPANSSQNRGLSDLPRSESRYSCRSRAESRPDSLFADVASETKQMLSETSALLGQKRSGISFVKQHNPSGLTRPDCLFADVASETEQLLAETSAVLGQKRSETLFVKQHHPSGLTVCDGRQILGNNEDFWFQQDRNSWQGQIQNCGGVVDAFPAEMLSWSCRNQQTNILGTASDQQLWETQLTAEDPDPWKRD